MQGFVACVSLHFPTQKLTQATSPKAYYYGSTKSEVGGVKPKVPPTGNPSPAPSTRTARTTRQINGARNRSVAKANSADFPAALLRPACPGPRGHRHVLFFRFCLYFQWNIDISWSTWRVHRPFMLESPLFL